MKSSVALQAYLKRYEKSSNVTKNRLDARNSQQIRVTAHFVKNYHFVVSRKKWDYIIFFVKNNRTGRANF